MISLHSLMPLAVLWSLFIFHIKHQRNAELVWRDAACPYSKLWGPSIICLQYTAAPRQGFYTENAVLLVLSTTLFSINYHQCQLWFPRSSQVRFLTKYCEVRWKLSSSTRSRHIHSGVCGRCQHSQSVLVWNCSPSCTPAPGHEVYTVPTKLF